MAKNLTTTPPPAPSPEEELDTLLANLGGQSDEAMSATGKTEPLQGLRDLMGNELIPVFAQLIEKYEPSGIYMRMDVSQFLEGGREVQWEFSVGNHRAVLHGTVTTEAIAFHETRYSPTVNGELISGPMLRLRGLNAQIFRQFVCQRLTVLLRDMLRGR